VAVVRYKKFGKRFEIAAYKNTVKNWRNGLETDLDEVLQSTTVFSNVSKGILAKREDMIQVFGTDDEEKICIKILQDGQLQVSEKERQVELENRVRDVAGILSEKCINPKSKKPYTIGVLERALKDIHFSADPKKPAKLQANETLPLLQAQFPIERAQMLLRIVVPVGSSQDFQALLARRRAVVTEQNIEGDDLVVECCIDPGAYRELNAFVVDEGQRGRLDVVSLAAFGEDKDDGAGDVGSGGRDGDVALGGVRGMGGPGGMDGMDGMDGMGGAEFVADRTAGLSIQDQRDGLAPAGPTPALVPRPVVRREKVEETVLYPRGPISGMPEEYAARRERFSEIDGLQEGWTVQLQTKGGSAEVLDAVFWGPAGERIGSFAMARRRALAHSKT
jgi:ribosome maturation protein SDO1